MTSHGDEEPGQKKIVVCLILGLFLIFAGLSIQAIISGKYSAPDDLDVEFQSTGTSTNVNEDHLFPYNPAYKMAGLGTVENSYTTTKTTTIKAFGESDRYVGYVYNTEIVQPSFMIDMRPGGAPAGENIVNMSVMGGDPTMPFPFQPHRAVNGSIMNLDKKEWNYDTASYKGADLPKKGYARSVFTHNLEKESYPIWVGSLGDTVDASFVGERAVRGIDGYEYHYEYSFPIPMGPVTSLVFTSETWEVHEPKTGILMRMETKFKYELEIQTGGPQPVTIELYSETSTFEMDAEDGDDIDSALTMIANFEMLSYVLLVVGMVALVATVFMGGKKR